MYLSEYGGHADQLLASITHFRLPSWRWFLLTFFTCVGGNIASYSSCELRVPSTCLSHLIRNPLDAFRYLIYEATLLHATKFTCCTPYATCRQRRPIYSLILLPCVWYKVTCCISHTTYCQFAIDIYSPIAARVASCMVTSKQFVWWTRGMSYGQVQWRSEDVA